MYWPSSGRRRWTTKVHRSFLKTHIILPCRQPVCPGRGRGGRPGGGGERQGVHLLLQCWSQRPHLSWQSHQEGFTAWWVILMADSVCNMCIPMTMICVLLICMSLQDNTLSLCMRPLLKRYTVCVQMCIFISMQGCVVQGWLKPMCVLK